MIRNMMYDQAFEVENRHAGDVHDDGPMRVREHQGYGHGLRPGEDWDINCPSCKAERRAQADAEMDYQAACERTVAGGRCQLCENDAAELLPWSGQRLCWDCVDLNLDLLAKAVQEATPVQPGYGVAGVITTITMEHEFVSAKAPASFAQRLADAIGEPYAGAVPSRARAEAAAVGMAADPRSVPCPYCRAAAGEHCRTMNGNLTGKYGTRVNHYRREVAARRKGAA